MNHDLYYPDRGPHEHYDHSNSLWMKILVPVSLMILGAVLLKIIFEQGNQKITGTTMGTTYSVKYLSDKRGLTPEVLKPQIDKLLSEFNQDLSTYIPNSQISKFRRHKSLQPFAISEDFFKITLAAKSIYDLSGGFYDPTIAPLIEAWGFGRKTSDEPPPKKKIASLLEKTGFDKITLDQEQKALRKKIPQVSLNLSSIAKGYAVDLVAKWLEDRGIEHFLLEIGGEITARGLNDGEKWLIGIETPDPDQRGSVIRYVTLAGKSLASSGSYRNYFKFQGESYSHIINPKTGYPVKHSTVSVTVMADSCLKADGLATALLVLGTERGRKKANQLGIAAAFIDRLPQEHLQQEPFFLKMMTNLHFTPRDTLKNNQPFNLSFSDAWPSANTSASEVRY